MAVVALEKKKRESCRLSKLTSAKIKVSKRKKNLTDGS